MKIAPDQQTAIMDDLVVYGNAFVHLANIDGELVARRLDPAKVTDKPKPKLPARLDRECPW